MRALLLWASVCTSSLGSAQNFADLVKADPANWFSYSGLSRQGFPAGAANVHPERYVTVFEASTI